MPLILKKTKKQKKRTDNKLKQKEEQDLIESLKQRYKLKTIDEIFDLSFEIIKRVNKTKEELLILKVLKFIIDEKKESGELNHTHNDSYIPYPTLDDKDFNEKIFNKKEFNINKSKKIDETLDLEQLVDKLCTFNLSSNQKFLKTYISTNTPYNGLLLFHGTGVGKTCSSISIAENFKEVLMETNKKITVLLNPSIKANFIKNIFNIEKLKELKTILKGKRNIDEGVNLEDIYDALSGCTKSEYLKEANINNSQLVKDPKYIDIISNKINKIIRNRYQFYGYGEFSNKLEKIKNQISQRFSDEEQINRVFSSSINKMFSESVMIIDEVHNTKETTDSKMLPKILKEVLNIVTNMKLLLLSATPMFDKPTEIISILNLLLINDKREPIKTKDIFDRNGDITEEGQIILVNKSRGYISYLRGEHPIKFPKRLYPNIFESSDAFRRFQQPLITTPPSKDLNNRDILVANRLNKLKIVGCKMKDYQLDKYNSINLEDSEDDMGAFNKNGLMASNIVYPSEEEELSITQLTGDNGFNRLLKKESRDTYSFIEEDYKKYFSKSEIHKYSTKISQIFNNIETSNGIIFIYSQFIKSGILPLAIALEMNGYSKFGGSLLKDGQDSDKKFLIISGDNELSKDAYSKYLKIENENKNGEKVKVIIGSETAAEGLDFKYIREVHVLEPWHHFNKIEQVIGRGIRNCSHKDLPKEERNVIVYLYASTLPSKELETIDLKMYRLSEKKMKQISEVEYILKTNAVDCNLNIEDNRFIADFYKKSYEQLTSKGTKHMLQLNDEDNSKMCNFKKCDFKCNPDISSERRLKLNTTTFDYKNVNDNIYDIQKIIKKLYKKDKNIMYSLKQLEDFYIFIFSNKNIDLLYYSLNELTKNKEIFSNAYGTFGFLKNNGDNYIFTPLYLKNQYSSFKDLMSSTTKKKERLDITKYRTKKKVKKIKSTHNELIQKIVTIKNTLENEIIKDKKNYESKLKDNNFSIAKKRQLINIYNELEKKRIFLYDYMIPKNKELLLQSLLLLKYKYRDLDIDVDNLLQDLQTNFIYIKRDIDSTSNYSDDYIWGYKIYNPTTNDIKYKQFNRTEFTFDDPKVSDLQKIKKSLNIKIRNENSNSIIGYLEYKKTTNEVVLKIRDKTNEGKKGTQIKTGSVCGNDGMKKDKIIKFITNVLNSVSEDNLVYSEDITKSSMPGKPNLCAELELYLRNYDSEIKNNFRWFYNLEEAVERELYKKVY